MQTQACHPRTGRCTCRPGVYESRRGRRPAGRMQTNGVQYGNLRLSLVRRSGIEAMFDHAQPYRARLKRPIERIEEFRSLEEIARNRNLSKSRIHKVAKSWGVQKVLHKGRTYLPKREADEIFKPKKTRPAVYITLEEALRRYPVSYQRLYYIIRKNDVPKLYDGRLMKVDAERLDTVIKHII